MTFARAAWRSIAAGRPGVRAWPMRCSLVKSKPLLGDALEFHLQANLLADGKGYIQPFLYQAEGIARASADKPPLYPFLEAGVSLLGGRTWAWHQLVGCARRDRRPSRSSGSWGGGSAGAAGRADRGRPGRGLPAARRRRRVAALGVGLRAVRHARAAGRAALTAMRRRRAGRRCWASRRGCGADARRGARAARAAGAAAVRWRTRRTASRRSPASWSWPLARALLDRLRPAGAHLDQRRRPAGGGQLRHAPTTAR